MLAFVTSCLLPQPALVVVFYHLLEVNVYLPAAAVYAVELVPMVLHCLLADRAKIVDFCPFQHTPKVHEMPAKGLYINVSLLANSAHPH